MKKNLLNVMVVLVATVLMTGVCVQAQERTYTDEELVTMYYAEYEGMSEDHGYRVETTGTSMFDGEEYIDYEVYQYGNLVRFGCVHKDHVIGLYE